MHCECKNHLCNISTGQKGEDRQEKTISSNKHLRKLVKKEKVGKSYRTIEKAEEEAL